MTGDSLFSLPVIRSLREAHPNSNITMVVSPRGYDLYRVSDSRFGVDTLISYDFYHPKFAQWSTRRKLNGRRFDAVFFLDTDLGYLNFFKENISSPNWYRMVTTRDQLGGVQIVQNSVGETAHICDQYLQLVEAYGVTPVRSYSIPLSPRSRHKADVFRKRLKLGARKVVGLHWGNHSKNTNILFPKETFDGRAWSMDSYVQLATQLMAVHPDTVFILTGGAYERPLVRQLHKKMTQAGVASINLASKTNDLVSLLGLLSILDLFVVGDTGPMHLASAVGVNTAALFFATSPMDTGPYNSRNSLTIQSPIPCAPCLNTPHSFRCPEGANCVQLLTSDAVHLAISSRFDWSGQC